MNVTRGTLNVFMKDRFICLGATGVEICMGNGPFIRFPIKRRLSSIIHYGEVPVAQRYATEDYEVKELYYRDGYTVRKAFCLVVDAERQTLGPLKLKPWCEIGWLFG